MSDVSVARGIIDDTFDIETRGRARVITLAFEAVKKVEARLPLKVIALRPRKWTERRVRSIVDREAGRIDHYEIQDLTAAAVEEARIERRRIQARDARLAALISASVAGAGEPDDQWHGGVAGGLDHAGGHRAETDPDFDQRKGWGR